MRRHSHHSACTVVHNSVISNVYRTLIPIDRIDKIPACKHPILFFAFSRPFNHGFFCSVFNEPDNLLLILCTFNKFFHSRMLWGKHKISYAEYSIRPCSKSRYINVHILSFKINFCTFTSTYPVLLHDLDLFRPFI